MFFISRLLILLENVRGPILLDVVSVGRVKGHLYQHLSFGNI